MLIVILTPMESGEESVSFDGGNRFFVILQPKDSSE